MKPRKIYLETTIFGYYFDKDLLAHPATVKLFDEIKAGKFEAYTSDYTFNELMDTRDVTRRENMIGLIEKFGIIQLDASDEILKLADTYIKAGVIPPSSLIDARHIACASVNNVNAIISLNFKHINRARTKEFIPHINKQNGYTSDIAIFAPMEVTENETN